MAYRIQESEELILEDSILGLEKDILPEKDNGSEVCEPSYKHTCELTEELKHREGVTAIEAGPYHRFNVGVDGPATVLIVYD